VSLGQPVWIPTERTPVAFWTLGGVCFGGLATFAAVVEYYQSVQLLGVGVSAIFALAIGSFILGFGVVASCWAFRPRAIRIHVAGLTVKRFLGRTRDYSWGDVRLFPARPPEFGRLVYKGRRTGLYILSPNQFSALRASPYQEDAPRKPE
jgi:hypothetical protein